MSGFVHAFDLKSSKTRPVISFTTVSGTHSRKVKGIRPDPFNSYSVATFTDVAGEPVKVSVQKQKCFVSLFLSKILTNYFSYEIVSRSILFVLMKMKMPLIFILILIEVFSNRFGICGKKSGMRPSLCAPSNPPATTQPRKRGRGRGSPRRKKRFVNLFS